MKRAPCADASSDVVHELHELHERNGRSANGIQRSADVLCLRSRERRAHGIFMVRMKLACRARTSPVRTAQVECRAVGAKVLALRSVQLAQTHHTGPLPAPRGSGSRTPGSSRQASAAGPSVGCQVRTRCLRVRAGSHLCATPVACLPAPCAQSPSMHVRRVAAYWPAARRH